MAFNHTVQGTITDQNGDPVSGMVVELEKDSPGNVVDTDTTDASGSYLVQGSSTDDGAGSYRANPQGDNHYTDPGEGPWRSWNAEGDQTYNENYSSTFSNSSPSMGSIVDPTYNADSGLHSETGSLSDPEGDDLTVYKDSGPYWGSVVKVNNSSYRWDFNTSGVAAGSYIFSAHVEDPYGASSSPVSVTVTIEAANTPPTLENPGVRSFERDTGDGRFFLNGSDAEDAGFELTYSKVSGPSWGSVTGAGEVTIGTNGVAVGDYSFTWRVTDTDGATDEATHTVRIVAGSIEWPFMSPIM